ncbi:hypothetical protein KSP35_02290 [Aquihabitans sp. G128]|uniref:hypothetical protein n=1 Tax=Aquihabitans sp. G128 TaxID=2849779 RepID=UPI001C245FB7|nr:hypothetical protein [Aquihabitans sp. G128]QXC61697.1 hypothetical protein KSP35_02290 [Aquihabitans sp. G128]
MTTTTTTPAPLPWRAIVRWALVGTVVLLALVLVDVHRYGGNNPVSLIQPGTGGPSTQVIARDFPELEQPDGSGLDGQMYYAVARDPFHLDQTAKQLDAPRYRLQRPLLSWLAWGVHPTGGGVGLVTGFFLVGLLGAFGGALATGALSAQLRGPTWLAALFPLLPGTYWSLRVTVSDALALALALGALALAQRQKQVPAVVLGVLAVLAKEPVILVFAGWALHRRTRRDALLLLVPGAVAAAWMGWLHVQFPADPSRPSDLGLPFVGLVDGWRAQWSRGHELVGLACTAGGYAIGVLALALRRLRHPLGWAIAIQLAFLSIMGLNPVTMNFGGTRMAMAVMVLGAITLFTPHAARALAGDDERTAGIEAADPEPTPERRPQPAQPSAVAAG